MHNNAENKGLFNFQLNCAIGCTADYEILFLLRNIIFTYSPISIYQVRGAKCPLLRVINEM